MWLTPSIAISVDFRFELTRDFHRELTRVDDVSRVAGGRSSGGFFLSCFGSCGACLEPEAVVACLKDVAMVGKPVQQCGGHLGVAEHPGRRCGWRCKGRARPDREGSRPAGAGRIKTGVLQICRIPKRSSGSHLAA